MADDDEEPRCKVSYLDVAEGAEEETNWIKRAGKARVIYPNGHSFEGRISAVTQTLLFCYRLPPYKFRNWSRLLRLIKELRSTSSFIMLFCFESHSIVMSRHL
jgi:hypothetical protein